ncbi:hypothetical protein [Fructobacillus ficulneus]|uniref:Uncharacterized protein n=1 Tax=Fructobacillus ficulneus TaxID=157463 RepID=A0A0K8MG10_9LACO|nr:hypothetical protein [Fructobacillus ficulneus]GAO99138.1 hypothetical protein FFIC_030180 [Fructobacillus ficulneus]
MKESVAIITIAALVLMFVSLAFWAAGNKDFALVCSNLGTIILLVALVWSTRSKSGDKD